MDIRNYDPDKVRERIQEIGDDWAEKQAVYNNLEENGKSLLAIITRRLIKSGVKSTEAGATARAEEGWLVHIKGLTVAHEAALKARVSYDNSRAWRDDMRSAIVTEREAMKIR